jgi:hypothetical protein
MNHLHCIVNGSDVVQVLSNLVGEMKAVSRDLAGGASNHMGNMVTQMRLLVCPKDLEYGRLTLSQQSV